MKKSTQKRTQKEAKELLHSKWPNITFDNYTNCNNKYEFTCTTCGHKWVTTYNAVLHSKCGCPNCGVKEAFKERTIALVKSRLKDTEEFLEYIDYNHIKVKCKICGNIRNTTSNNLMRYGCNLCGYKKTTEKRTFTNEQFIKKAKSIHGDKYDYSKVNYIQNKTPVEIICPVHGSFFQAPVKHVIVGHGCPKCAGQNTTFEEFLKRAKLKHGNFYNYDKVEFVNMVTPITVTCPIHGDFQIIPTNHVNYGCGCKKCHESTGEKLVNSILEDLNIQFTREVCILNPYNDHNFRVDFYINYCDQNYIIEYNGPQHYKPVKMMGGVLAYEVRKQRDEDLRKYCVENNIKLLEIKYNDKNIQEKIEHFLSVPSNQVTDQLLQSKNGEG